MSDAAQRTRLFLDTGVIIEGCALRWGASKVILVLCTYQHYTVVLAEDVEEEIRRVLARKSASLSPSEAHALETDVAGWMARVHLERWPKPTAEQVHQHAATILPALRHVNDLRLVVTAFLAQPDWVVSANPAHWNVEVAIRLGLRIATPQQFVRRLIPPTA